MRCNAIEAALGQGSLVRVVFCPCANRNVCRPRRGAGSTGPRGDTRPQSPQPRRESSTHGYIPRLECPAQNTLPY